MCGKPYDYLPTSHYLTIWSREYQELTQYRLSSFISKYCLIVYCMHMLHGVTKEWDTI